MRRAQLPRLLAALPLALGLALVPEPVEAAPPSWDQGGYVYVAPGTVAVELDNGDANWQGGVGGGYLWNPGSHFFIGLGGAVSHMVDGRGPNGMITRGLVELRIGGGNRFWWIYGVMGPGLGLVYHDRRNNRNDVTPTFNFRTGPGVQFLVWRGLFIGLEANFEFIVGAGGGVGAVGGPRPFIGWHF
ncbi:MAG: hypothetical protein KC431_31665 [Myxococcales bacterium]|nr:hypothetical protein [Myxococcales bacterium]MCA9702122.1 hypothetical protein [Myxococcales bacterium]